ncbi:MAG: GTP cyclohydrolase II [Acidobacteria bacterium]|nr:GTP cyclohydrolase II [Acidobacteriota bacterium]
MTRSSNRRRNAGSRIQQSPVDRVILGVDAFRRGKPVSLRENGAACTFYAVETLSEAVLKTLRAGRPPLLVLTHARARTLKIRLYTPEVVALNVSADFDATRLRAIADPGDDLTFPMKGPFVAIRARLPASYAAAVKLAKLAGLLPAVAVQRAKVARAAAVQLAVSDVLAYDDEIVRTLQLVTRARVPLEGAQKTELISFRPADGGPEHYAIVINAPPTAKPVLTRLHSECFTGDLLASLKCDCGAQLRGAIKVIAEAGGGILLYLAQEGRGIGLINKLMAYELQDAGADTVEANEQLGFEADLRTYQVAVEVLRHFGMTRVRFLSNNPDKIQALEDAGIRVEERIPCEVTPTSSTRHYLRTKKKKLGHMLKGL